MRQDQQTSRRAAGASRAPWPARWHPWLYFAVVCFLSVVRIGYANDSVPASQNQDPRDQKIELLLQRVNDLERKIQSLEGKVSATPPPVSNTHAPSASGGSSASAPEPGIKPSWDADELGADAVREHHLFPNLTFKGFGDIQYRYSDAAGVNNSFALGQLVLFPMSRIADNLSAFSEIAFSYGSDNKASATIERMLLQYTPLDYLNVGVGRYHTGLGYFNSAYHHGAWLQTAIGRPIIYNASVIFPVHNVGVTLSGNIPSGRQRLAYVLEVGNGRRYGARTEEANQSVTDDNVYKSVNFGILSRPLWAEGLELGLTAYHDFLTPSIGPAVDQFIFVSHAVYKSKPWEILNEFMLYRHDPRGAAKASLTPGFYSQVGYQINRLTPYFRYDYQNAPSGDVIFKNYGTVDAQHGPTVGVRFDFSDFAAFKLQYGRVYRAGQSPVDSVTAQVAYTF